MMSKKKDRCYCEICDKITECRIDNRRFELVSVAGMTLVAPQRHAWCTVCLSDAFPTMVSDFNIANAHAAYVLASSDTKHITREEAEKTLRKNGVYPERTYKE